MTSINNSNIYKKYDQQILPRGDHYFKPFLSPSYNKNKVRESVPQGEVTDRQYGRVILQIHQILHLLNQQNVKLEGKKFHDIGTGNGLIPKLLLKLSSISEAVGSDPYPSSHKTSWVLNNQENFLNSVLEKIQKLSGNILDYNKYKQLLDYENHSFIPRDISIKCEKNNKPYRFINKSVHELKVDNEKYDIFYFKAIEHISDWKGVFSSIRKVSNQKAVLYIKHRSFFSYLGPHRYSSLDIPWGHLLLNDEEYKEYVKEYFPNDSKMMIDFYFNKLTFPRKTVPDMIQIAKDENFLPLIIITEPPRYLKKITNFISEIPNFWEIIRKNFPKLGADEVFSGMHHIILRLED